MELGKHTSEAQEIKRLNKVIKEKDEEIQNLKLEFSDLLLIIRNLNESNKYGNESVIKRKISELCTDERYNLLIIKNKEELPTTNQSNK